MQYRNSALGKTISCRSRDKLCEVDVGLQTKVIAYHVSVSGPKYIS